MPPVRVPLNVPALVDRSCDVVGLGQNSVDLVAMLREFPTSNSKQQIERFARFPGGEWLTLDGRTMTVADWEAPDCPGLRFASPGYGFTIDRAARTITPIGA